MNFLYLAGQVLNFQIVNFEYLTNHILNFEYFAGQILDFQYLGSQILSFRYLVRQVLNFQIVILNIWQANKATFIRRISAVSNAIQTIDNEANHLVMYCLNCIRHGRNATYEPGLNLEFLNLKFSIFGWPNFKFEIFKYLACISKSCPESFWRLFIED